jgi:hypothetical protein
MCRGSDYADLVMATGGIYAQVDPDDQGQNLGKNQKE